MLSLSVISDGGGIFLLMFIKVVPERLFLKPWRCNVLHDYLPMAWVIVMKVTIFFAEKLYFATTKKSFFTWFESQFALYLISLYVTFHSPHVIGLFIVCQHAGLKRNKSNESNDSFLHVRLITWAHSSYPFVRLWWRTNRTRWILAYFY